MSFNCFAIDVEGVNVGLKIHEDRENLDVSRSVELSTKFNVISGKALEHKEKLKSHLEESLTDLDAFKLLIEQNSKSKNIINIAYDSKSRELKNKILKRLKEIYKLAANRSIKKSSEIKSLISIEKKIIQYEVENTKKQEPMQLRELKIKPLSKLGKEILLETEGSYVEKGILEHEYAFEKIEAKKVIDSYEIAIRKDQIDTGEDDLRVGFKLNFNLGGDNLANQVNNHKYIQKKVGLVKDKIELNQDTLKQFNDIKMNIASLEKIKRMKSFKRLKSSTSSSKLLRTMSRLDRLNLELELTEFELELSEIERSIYLKIFAYEILTKKSLNIIKEQA